MILDFSMIAFDKKLNDGTNIFSNVRYFKKVIQNFLFMILLDLSIITLKKND